MSFEILEFVLIDTVSCCLVFIWRLVYFGHDFHASFSYFLKRNPNESIGKYILQIIIWKFTHRRYWFNFLTEKWAIFIWIVWVFILSGILLSSLSYPHLRWLVQNEMRWLVGLARSIARFWTSFLGIWGWVWWIEGLGC